MKRKRFTDEQIAFALRPAETGMPVAALSRVIRHDLKAIYIRRFA